MPKMPEKEIKVERAVGGMGGSLEEINDPDY